MPTPARRFNDMIRRLIRTGDLEEDGERVRLAPKLRRRFRVR
jgi:hypothetical protein